MRALEGEQLAHPIEGRARAVPHGHVRAGEVPVPRLLGVERQQRAAARQRQVGHVRAHSHRQRRHPQRVAANSIPGPPPGARWAIRLAGQPDGPCSRRARATSGEEVRRAVLPRPVQVEHQHRHDQHQPRAAGGARQRPQHARPSPPSLARAPEEAHRQRQIQRLRVHRGEEERHRRERRHEHRQPRHVAVGAVGDKAAKFQRAQAVDSIQRRRQRHQR